MIGEINETFYCLAGKNPKVTCPTFDYCKTGEPKCFFRRYKHPTPDQFFEDYGEEVPDDMPVLVRLGERKNWEVTEYKLTRGEKFYDWKSRRYETITAIVVCCTPWGNPGKVWRPQ